METQVNNDKSCPVCYKELSNMIGEKKYLSCYHFMCTECYIKIIIDSIIKCPMCRHATIDWGSKYANFANELNQQEHRIYNFRAEIRVLMKEIADCNSKRHKLEDIIKCKDNIIKQLQKIQKITSDKVML